MTGQMAVLGAGKTGVGWAARFALMGWHVRVFDPAPKAKTRLSGAILAARACLPALYDVALPPASAITYHDSLAEAVSGVDWVQDGLPDRLALKQKMYQAVQASLAEDAIIAARSESADADELQDCATRPEQIVTVIAEGPIWLSPNVVLQAGQKTPEPVLAKARSILQSIGMRVLAAPDTAPILTGLSPETAVAVLRTLKAQNADGIGAVLAAHEVALAPAMPDMSAPPVTLDRQVPPDWVDYNGHMNETHYLTAFSNATDRLLLWAGMDAECIAAGQSVFSVETHLRHLGEVDIGDQITVTTRVLDGGGKRLHLWHEMRRGADLVATGEQMLLHVDLATRRPAAPPEEVGQFLATASGAHADLPPPDGLGRAVGQPR